MMFPSFLVHGLDTLAEIGRILKPSGKLSLAEPAGMFMLWIWSRNLTWCNGAYLDHLLMVYLMKYSFRLTGDLSLLYVLKPLC